MTTTIADAYDLGSGVVACIYCPIPDQHLPLIGPVGDGWQLFTWSIVPGASGMATYLIVLRTPATAPQILPSEVRLGTSFGPRNLVLQPDTAPLPKPLAATLAELLLSIAGQQTPEDLAGLIAVLANLPLAETTKALAGQRTSVDGRSRLVIDGCHAGYYVVGRTGKSALIACITAIRYQGHDTIQTTLELDRPIDIGTFWLLGDGQFQELAVTEGGR